MLKTNDKVIVCSSDQENSRVGTFLVMNEKIHGVQVPDVMFDSGHMMVCFGHVVPYSDDLMERLLKLTGEQQFELLTAIKEWDGGKELILMRGLPGSGKSTKARNLAGATGQVFSTDDYFCLNESKEYRFDANKLGKAHKWNHKRSLAALDADIPTVVIDNTNTTIKELRGYLPHIKKAMQLGYKVIIEEPETSWRFDIDELVKMNTHGVPKQAIERMLNRYVKDVKVEDIMF